MRIRKTTREALLVIGALLLLGVVILATEMSWLSLLLLPIALLVLQYQPLRVAVIARANYLLRKFSPPKIVFVGDSLTAFGGTWWDVSLRAVNLGVPKLEVRQIVGQATCASEYHPEFIAVLAGSNDVLNPRISEKQILSDYRDLLDECKASVIVTLIPMQNGLAPRINRVNDGIREIALQHGASVIDLNPVIAFGGGLSPKFTIDGIHLSRTAYKVWEGEIRKALTPPYVAPRTA